MAYNPHSSSSNLLSDLHNLEGQISSDEPDPTAARAGGATAASSSSSRSQHVQPPPPRSQGAGGAATSMSSADLEAQESIWKQSAHPVALLFLFLFRCCAIATYLLCGFFSSSYVFSVRFLSNDDMYARASD